MYSIRIALATALGVITFLDSGPWGLWLLAAMNFVGALAMRRALSLTRVSTMSWAIALVDEDNGLPLLTLFIFFSTV